MDNPIHKDYAGDDTYEVFGDGSICIDGYYWITADRLEERDSWRQNKLSWPHHLYGKRFWHYSVLLDCFNKAIDASNLDGKELLKEQYKEEFDSLTQISSKSWNL